VGLGNVFSSIAHEIALNAHHASTSSHQGAQSFGKSAVQQLFGTKSDNEEMRHDQIQQKKKEDEEFSQQHIAKVMSQYNEFYAKKKRQEEVSKQHEELEQKAKKMEDLNEKKVERQKSAQIAKAISSSSAETRSNMGNE